MPVSYTHLDVYKRQALHTVTVRNWDMTITTIPTKKLISDSFKNWRGMNEACLLYTSRCV